jgi:hypothetical protein
VLYITLVIQLGVLVLTVVKQFQYAISINTPKHIISFTRCHWFSSPQWKYWISTYSLPCDSVNWFSQRLVVVFISFRSHWKPAPFPNCLLSFVKFMKSNLYPFLHLVAQIHWWKVPSVAYLTWLPAWNFWHFSDLFIIIYWCVTSIWIHTEFAVNSYKLCSKSLICMDEISYARFEWNDFF